MAILDTNGAAPDSASLSSSSGSTVNPGHVASRDKRLDSPVAKQRLIVGISGASGAIYGVRLLELLRTAGVETHLVMSNAAGVTLSHEVGKPLSDVRALADQSYGQKDLSAPIASGSFRTAGMIIAPCSVRTMSGIAAGGAEGLLARAADVVLKERRRLVLLLRETPLHLGHLRAMTAVTEMGAIIAPPVPAFYAKPENLEQMIDYTLGRVLDLFDIDIDLAGRWNGLHSMTAK
ncbi:UbiX family flavin prenyltransferase [Bradyrhizobium genosp. L]|uniref:UbiX family flavin prenyltransferase n=1 Tax=Bradyrhizobium genosp. L TaxID=83637 RepID=UPI0018A2BE5F|nr:UbiX family flavin prenyltransferase [Bradyrhizobium genosp. L]QPF83782.1 UbiX family flavin prenyltransferase [Bradyrhizobium genosp. L]